MSTNKHAQIRYLSLDKCFSNTGRKYYIDDLVKACNDAIYDFTGKHDGVKKRQVYEDIKFMESQVGYNIELERFKDGRKIFFKYSDSSFSINKSPLNEIEVNQINEVLLTLSRFKGMPQFEWIDDISSRLSNINNQGNTKIIDFEQNQFLKGLEFITPLFNAIFFKRVLKVKYLSFKSNEEIVHLIHPYYLKQYNLRWFLFGLNEKENKISNQALDRVLSVEETSKKFISNNEIDFNEFFEDVIGVTVTENSVEKILLKISNKVFPYIFTKPIHGSQKIKEKGENFSFITLDLIPNYEFESLILSYGEAIEIVEPKTIRENIKKRIELNLNNYK